MLDASDAGLEARRFSRPKSRDRFTVDWFQRESGEPVSSIADADGRVSGVTIGPYSLRRFDPLGE